MFIVKFAHDLVHGKGKKRKEEPIARFPWGIDS